MRTRPSAPRLLALAAAGAVVLAGCGSSPASGPPSRTLTPLPTKQVPRSVAERCLVDVPGEVVDLPSATAPDRLGAVAYGSGSTALVLLHQTGRGGLCGWVTYARWAAEKGVLAVAVDDCTHGSSTCTGPAAGDTRAMVALAVDWARARGATRVAVVGASMGGARALGVGQAAGADVVVDLSGPAHWDGVPDAVDAARATTVPLLVVTSAADRGIPADELSAAVAASPAVPKRFVKLPGRLHGWDITMDGIAADAAVTPTGRLVLDWARGRSVD